MTEQPFKDDEVLWRWKSPETEDSAWTEYALVRRVSDENGFWWAQWEGHGWQCFDTVMAREAQLLRELTAARQERDRLAAVMQSTAITLRQEFAGADDKEMEMAFGIADSLSASIAQPYPAEQGMSDKGKPPQPSGAMKEREYVNTDQM